MQGTLLLMKPNFIPCIFMGHTKDNKVSVFFMEDCHDVLIQNILLVSSPKYTEIGVKLQYYDEKSNKWITCTL